MTNKHRKLGIIAGGGSIPKKLIDFCKENGRDYFVLAIEGNADKNLIFLIWCRISEQPHFLLKLA